MNEALFDALMAFGSTAFTSFLCGWAIGRRGARRDSEEVLALLRERDDLRRQLEAGTP